MVKFESPIKSDQILPAFFQNIILRWLVLSFLFIMAFGLRIYRINEPALDFHPIRQYRSALIARAYYYETQKSKTVWQRDVARINVQQEGILEPPIIEFIAATAYRLSGGEYLWIPRLLSSLFWLIGGVFLYLIAVKLGSIDAAIVSIAFYLFLPFGIAASRSFQPDLLMIMMLLFSLYTLLRYFELPSFRRLLITAVVSATAILIKPVCLFIIFGAFISLAICKQNLTKLRQNLNLLIFAIISFIPSILFYVYGIFIAGFLRGQAQVSFQPQLILELFFWQFWLKHIHGVVGFGALIASLFGVLLFRKGWQQGLILGLWTGYIVFGLVFTFHIHTHDYYQLQFIPIVALSLGPVGALLLNHFIQVDGRWHWRIIVGGNFLLAVFLNVGLYLRNLEEFPDFGQEVKQAQEIGEIVSHSTRTLFLDQRGQPLRYYGEFSGNYWPYIGEIRASKLWGEPEMTVEERFNKLNSNNSYDYFIVTDKQEFDAQLDLKEFLTPRFPLLVKNDAYMIFDLREGLEVGR